MEALVAPDRNGQVALGRRLNRLTLGYNALEGIVALAAGAAAGSVALIGFGFDSGIELAAGLAALWRLSADLDPVRRERVERITLRVVGGSFVLLASYVAWEAGRALWRREAPDDSLPGIVLAAASVVVMPILARAKRRVARALGSAALEAEAKQTSLCSYLSAILLGGLILHAGLGWWWADPVAAFVMVPIIAREGVDGLRGRNTCPSCGDGCHG